MIEYSCMQTCATDPTVVTIETIFQYSNAVQYNAMLLQ